MQGKGSQRGREQTEQTVDTENDTQNPEPSGCESNALHTGLNWFSTGSQLVTHYVTGQNNLKRMNRYRSNQQYLHVPLKTRSQQESATTGAKVIGIARRELS